MRRLFHIPIAIVCILAMALSAGASLIEGRSSVALSAAEISGDRTVFGLRDHAVERDAELPCRKHLAVPSNEKRCHGAHGSGMLTLRTRHDDDQLDAAFANVGQTDDLRRLDPRNIRLVEPNGLRLRSSGADRAPFWGVFAYSGRLRT